MSAGPDPGRGSARAAAGRAPGLQGQERADGLRSAPGAGMVIGLLGPTAVGKTAVATALATTLGVRVVSCDSMQVYVGFPVLTNQPRLRDTEGAQHALVGFVDPLAPFSAAQYADCARPLVAEDVAAHGVALLAGGTGLYLRAAVAPLAVAPGDAQVRARLEERAAGEGPGALHAELARLDPAAAVAVDPRNSRRVVRALEAVLVGGAGWSGRDDLWNPRYERPTLVVGLTLDREILYPRIDARVGRMLQEGAIEEVRRFREARGPETTLPGGSGIRSAIGYPEICGYLDGRLSREEAAEEMAAATRRYARRQLTWLRKVKDAVMMNVRDREPEDMAREILDLAGG